MKISKKFVLALDSYKRKTKKPFYRIYRDAGYKGDASRISHLINGSVELKPTNIMPLILIGKLLNLKDKEVFTDE